MELEETARFAREAGSGLTSLRRRAPPEGVAHAPSTSGDDTAAVRHGQSVEDRSDRVHHMASTKRTTSSGVGNRTAWRPGLSSKCPQRGSARFARTTRQLLRGNPQTRRGGDRGPRGSRMDGPPACVWTPEGLWSASQTCVASPQAVPGACRAGWARSGRRLGEALGRAEHLGSIPSRNLVAPSLQGQAEPRSVAAEITSISQHRPATRARNVTKPSSSTNQKLAPSIVEALGTLRSGTLDSMRCISTSGERP